MYSLTHEVVKGMNIVTALQNHPNMPSVDQVFVELDYFVEYVKDSERFYGVPFRHKASTDDRKNKEQEPQYDVVSDTKAHFREFFFNGSQEQTFGFRPRALFCLVMEPLLDSMSDLSHDEILDSIPNIIEQLKEIAVIADHGQKLDSAVAYKLYKQMTTAHQQEKKIKEITAGVMKLRRKTVALAREINKLGKS